MKEVVDWAMTNIGPNVTKYTTDQPTIQQLLESGAIDAFAFWNATARLEYLGGQQGRRPARAGDDLPGQRLPLDPEEAPHPVLAQVFINWRLAPDVQFPNAWPIDHGQWSELSEGFLGPGLREPRPRLVQGRLLHLLPDPRPDQDAASSRSTGTRTTPAAKVWQDYYASKIGQ